METYIIYSGESGNRGLVFMCVAESSTQGKGFAVEDYFLPDTTDIKMAGKITVEGDVHLLPEWFEVKG